MAGNSVTLRSRLLHHKERRTRGRQLSEQASHEAVRKIADGRKRAWSLGRTFC